MAVEKEMRAMALDQFGGVDGLKPRTLPVPEVGAGEVRIRVEAAGVGVWDEYEMQGYFAKMLGGSPKFPYVPGSDCAGTIEAIGAGVKRFRGGDRVYAFALGNAKGGAFAEHVVVKAGQVAPVPGKLTAVQAGAMPVDAMTALRGLEALQLKKGEALMIFGAGGGVGHLALQLAKRMGVRVLAVASGEDGVRLAQRLGADHAVNGRTGDLAAAGQAFAAGGLDAALLTAGGKAANEALTMLRPGGRAAYPNGVQPAPQPPAGVTVQSYDGWPDEQAIERLNHWIEAGAFEVHVARTFPLEQAAEAERALAEHYLGKLALRLDGR